jgi:hypothetical protein
LQRGNAFNILTLHNSGPRLRATYVKERSRLASARRAKASFQLSGFKLSAFPQKVSLPSNENAFFLKIFFWNVVVTAKKLANHCHYLGYRN